MHKDLEQYIVNRGLAHFFEEETVTPNPEDLLGAKESAESLYRLFFDVFSDIEDDKVVLTDENKPEVLGIVDRMCEHARIGGLDVLSTLEIGVEELGNRLKTMVELNYRVQRGEDVHDVFRELSGGQELS